MIQCGTDKRNYLDVIIEKMYSEDLKGVENSDAVTIINKKYDISQKLFSYYRASQLTQKLKSMEQETKNLNTVYY